MASRLRNKTARRMYAELLKNARHTGRAFRFWQRQPAQAWKDNYKPQLQKECAQNSKSAPASAGTAQNRWMNNFSSKKNRLLSEVETTDFTFIVASTTLSHRVICWLSDFEIISVNVQNSVVRLFPQRAWRVSVNKCLIRLSRCADISERRIRRLVELTF